MRSNFKIVNIKKNLERKYTKQNMLSFAEQCMTEFASKQDNTTGLGYSEIDSLDVRKIKSILNKYRE